MALRGAPIDAVQTFKGNEDARRQLLDWLEQQGLRSVSAHNPSDHYVAACAAAMATWEWQVKESVCGCPADPPFHPFGFACW